MKNNDLSNRVVPHDVIVWEGLLGVIPQDRRAQAAAAKFVKRQKWQRVLDQYVVNEMMARKIWDLVWRYSMTIDVVTYIHPEFARLLEERLDKENIPARHVFYADPYVLARDLAVKPDIRNVYDPDPAHQFVYGSKGRVLFPDQYNLLGGL